MAKNDKVEEKQTEEMQAIEKLAIKEKIPSWQVAGVMAANNWASGKQLTLAEFKAALEAFLKGPMTGPMTGGSKNG